MNFLRKFVIRWTSRVVLKLFNPDELRTFRKLENVSIKLLEHKIHRLFNETCVNNDLLPNYTNVNLHDQAARAEDFTLEYRKCLVLRQISEQHLKIKELTAGKDEMSQQLKDKLNSPTKFKASISLLEGIIDAKRVTLVIKHNRKLNQLNGSEILMKEDRTEVVNLSIEKIDEDIKAVFRYGMNCHLRGRYDKLKKKIHIEKLYKSVRDLRNDGIVEVDNDDLLRCELKRFGLQNVHDYNKDIITREQYLKVKEFNDNPKIIVRKADKNNTFVVLNTDDYRRKIDNMLSDGSKFEKLNTNPTLDLRRKLRALIEAQNAKADSTKFKIPIGHYEPGYIYGNPKIHKRKEDPPLRPIISQIGTPTYEIAKKLNSILSPYMPNNHMIKSTSEFIDIAHSFSGKGYL